MCDGWGVAATVEVMRSTETTSVRLPVRILTRLFYHRDGELSPLKICASAIAAIIVFSAIAVPLLRSAGVTSSTAIATWVLILLLGVKLPALAVFWWMLGRHLERPGSERLTSDDVRSLIERIEAQAAAVRRPDPAAEFQQLLDDAWFVADRAPDADKASAVACALHIQEMAAGRERTAERSSPRDARSDPA